MAKKTENKKTRNCVAEDDNGVAVDDDDKSFLVGKLEFPRRPYHNDIPFYAKWRRESGQALANSHATQVPCFHFPEGSLWVAKYLRSYTFRTDYSIYITVTLT